YVNGNLAGSAAYSGGWQATGNLQIGRGRWNGAPTDYFPGSIEEVRGYSHALTATEVASVYHLGDGLVARWALDETAGTSAADLVGGHTATVTGGVSWGGGYSGGAVILNGTSGCLGTAGAVLRTDQSFTVSAWVRLTSVAGFATVVRQDGTQASGFFLQYSAADNR